MVQFYRIQGLFDVDQFTEIVVLLLPNLEMHQLGVDRDEFSHRLEIDDDSLFIHDAEDVHI